MNWIGVLIGYHYLTYHFEATRGGVAHSVTKIDWLWV